MTDIAIIANITRETDKAIQINTGDRLVWVPKSLIELEGDVVLCKKWFAKKNGIGKYGATTVLVG
jgi:hypothetical protein